MNKKKTAIIAGATGLTGDHLLRFILEDPDIEQVKVIGRKKPELVHPKIKFLSTDFSDIEQINKFIQGDQCFCCLGTTIKKAGSKEAFKKVDLEIPVILGQIAKKNQIPVFAVVSSIGANASSSNFYLQTKGKMENEILKLSFKNTIIARPSLLLGKRKEFRFGEEAGKLVMKGLSLLFIGPLKKYRAIESKTVAHAIYLLANNNPGKKIFDSQELEEIGGTIKTDQR